MDLKRRFHASRRRWLRGGIGPRLFLAALGLQSLPVAGWGADAREKIFDLPPGEAAVTLKAFSRQSGDEIVYLADQVRAVRTQGIHGRLTPREGLERMLDGSGLSIVQDPRTGAFAVRQAFVEDQTPAPKAPLIPPARDRIVLLPPIFVEKPRLSAPRWRYTKIADLEFLSCCDDVTTQELIERVYHLNQRLEAFLPAAFRVHLAVPTSFVLYGEAQQPIGYREIVSDMERLPGPPRATAQANTEAMTIRYLPNLRFSDRDELSVMYIPKDKLSGGGDIHLNGALVRFLMDHRTPPLPRWFLEGMMALYQNSSLEVEPLNFREFSAYVPEGYKAEILPYGSALIRLPNEMFGSETRKLFNREPAWRSKLLPMAEVFSPAPPVGESGPVPDNAGESGANGKNFRYLRWSSQSALFIHWALSNDDGRSRSAFWTFAERAAVEPVTEALFKEYFGLSFGEMDRGLVRYFPGAARAGIRLYSDEVPELGAVTMRTATEAEIGRIKGNLERLEVAYVKTKYPALTPRYLAQARHTLRRAYDRGSRDPGLLEVMGLCECDAGDDAAARPYLLAAVKAGAARPRVYYELARIRYLEFRTNDALGRFSPEQTAELLNLLSMARAHSPPLPEVYELIAEVWQRSVVAPRRANLAVLDEGVRFFPANLRLLYFTAALEAAHGFRAEAAPLVERGLRLAPEGSDREQFAKLQGGSRIVP